MRLTILANPASGRGRVFRKLQSYVRCWPHPDWQVSLIETRGPEHAGLMALEQCENPPDVLVVCGGDGTLKEVVSSLPAPPFPVGIVPAGTENVLAREMRIPSEPADAIKVAIGGHVRRVDLGILEGRTRHRFLLMAGIGFDAHVVAHVGPGSKRRLGKLSFFLTVLRSIPSYGFQEFRIKADETEFAAASCVIANARNYGGGLRLTPDADMMDGMLDVLAIRRSSAAEFAMMILSARLGTSPTGPTIMRSRASRIQIDGPRGIWVHADGEPIGTLPVEISVAKSSFPLLVPAD